MRDICYEHQAVAALDTARIFWPRVDEVIQVLEWTLVRDPTAGLSLSPGDQRRLVIFKGAKSAKLPTVECTFEVHADRLIFHDLEFS